MFMYLSPTGDLRLRLPEDERDAFMKKYRTKVALSYGVVMKEFVAVPPGLFARTAELNPYLAISRAYADRSVPRRAPNAPHLEPRNDRARVKAPPLPSRR